MHGIGFAQQLAAGGVQGMVGLLVAGDLYTGGGVGEPHGGERHAGHRLVKITAAGGEAVDDLESRHQQWGVADYGCEVFLAAGSQTTGPWNERG